MRSGVEFLGRPPNFLGRGQLLSKASKYIGVSGFSDDVSDRRTRSSGEAGHSLSNEPRGNVISRGCECGTGVAMGGVRRPTRTH